MQSSGIEIVLHVNIDQDVKNTWSITICIYCIPVLSN